MVLSAQLPEPAANKGKIHENTSETLDIEVENISGSQYADYVAASKERALQPMQNRLLIHTGHIILTATV